MSSRGSSVAAIFVLLLLLVSGGHGQILWVETTQGDFSDGTHERDLYASHRGGGAVEFAPRFDLNDDGYLDLFTSNRFLPYAAVYWGSASGYSPTDRRLFPIPARGGNCKGADLNLDGYTDFVIKVYSNPVLIFWGTPTGPDSSNTTEIPVAGGTGEACFIADLDKDGYLDMTIDHFRDGIGCILWGSAAGYDSAMRTELPVEIGQHNIEVGDLNRDGWLDIVFNNLPYYPIYWGSPSGFSAANRTTLPTLDVSGAHGLSIADLNGDGFLDIITTGWYHTGSQIYWGSQSGYSPGDVQILYPGYSMGGSTIADMNEDGFLDIVYHHAGSGRAPQKIYWGSATGYSDANQTEVGIPVEVSGGFVADFDFDGNLDIFANGVFSSSYVFWGPDFTSNVALPVDYDHHGTFREIGNVYTREYNESYISSIFDAGDVVDWGDISWVDSLPGGTDITVQVKSGDTPAPDPTWSDWLTLSNGEAIPGSLDARYLQYQAVFSYTNPSRLPLLFEVSIGEVGIEERPGPETRISRFELNQNEPNPFDRQTVIGYSVPATGRVTLRVYDISGRLVETLVNNEQDPGLYRVEWSPERSSNGIYFYRLHAQGLVGIKKMILLR